MTKIINLPNSCDFKEVDSVIDGFKDLNLEYKESAKFSDVSAPITVWLPKTYKDKFDNLQSASNRKFGKLLQDVLKKAIDSIK